MNAWRSARFGSSRGFLRAATSARCWHHAYPSNSSCCTRDDREKAVSRARIQVIVPQQTVCSFGYTNADLAAGSDGNRREEPRRKGHVALVFDVFDEAGDRAFATVDDVRMGAPCAASLQRSIAMARDA